MKKQIPISSPLIWGVGGRAAVSRIIYDESAKRPCFSMLQAGHGQHPESVIRADFLDVRVHAKHLLNHLSKTLGLIEFPEILFIDFRFTEDPARIRRDAEKLKWMLDTRGIHCGMETTPEATQIQIRAYLTDRKDLARLDDAFHASSIQTFNNFRFPDRTVVEIGLFSDVIRVYQDQVDATVQERDSKKDHCTDGGVGPLEALSLALEVEKLDMQIAHIEGIIHHLQKRVKLPRSLR